MAYTSIAISSGHGKKIRGASGSPIPPLCDEVDEVRKITNKVAELLINRGAKVWVFHDDTSTNQSTNLSTIVSAHNGFPKHELDVSVHLNAFSDPNANGVEVLYVSQDKLAAELSAAISKAGPFTNRGGKLRNDLSFLNNTNAPAVLLEVFFCTNKSDCEKYRKNFDAICASIADTLAGTSETVEPPEDETAFSFHAQGMCSWFGGPDDLTGVSDTEDLAFIYDVYDAPWVFLPEDTPGTEGMGLARRLNSHAVNYVACRWPYDSSTKGAWREALLENMALVRNVATGRETLAFCVDWGPHEEKTGRAADLSQALMRDLRLVTDDIVEVIFPAPDPEED